MGSVFIQVTVLSLLAVVLGVMLGRYAWPRRPHRRDTSSASAVPVSSLPEPQGGVQTGVAGTPPGSLPGAVPWACVAELEARLSESQSTLKETWRQLRQTEAELSRVQRQVQELEDRKEAEMGRLESGAIAALESTIAAHREHVAKLEAKLRAAESAAQEHVRELAVERRRSAQLQSALAERDQHIATLVSERV